MQKSISKRDAQASEHIPAGVLLTHVQQPAALSAQGLQTASRGAWSRTAWRNAPVAAAWAGWGAARTPHSS